MLTSVKYAVSWCYREGEKGICRTLYAAKPEPCVEAARLISDNPYSFDVEVRECDTGRPIAWRSPVIGQVLCPKIQDLES